MGESIWESDRFCSLVCYGRRIMTLLVTGLIWTVAKLAGFMPSGLASFSWCRFRKQLVSVREFAFVTLKVALVRMVKDL